MTAYIEIILEQKIDHGKSVAIPDEIRDFLITRLPKEMMCSSTLKSDDENVEVQTFTLAKHKALRFEHIQPNHENLVNFIIIDDDGVEPDNYMDLPVPPPNLVVINPKSGHSQKWYFLKNGVPQTYFGSKKSKNYLETTAFKLRAIYNGDNCYKGGLARNPLSNRHIVFSPRSEPYTLNEINACIGVTKDDYAQENQYKSDAFSLIRDYCSRHKKMSEAVGFGRNCTIFEILRHQAYREWHEYASEKAFATHLQAEAGKINQNHFPDNLLPKNELKHISNSIARYCFSRRRRTTGNLKSFSDKQKNRGAIGGQVRSAQYDDARAKFKELYSQNPHLTPKQLAELCGVSDRTIRNYRKKMQSELPQLSLEEEDIYQRSNRYLAKRLGVSVRTIQRRRAKSKILSSHAINRALLKNALSTGGDIMESSHFRYFQSGQLFDHHAFTLFTCCSLISVPFLIPFPIIRLN